MRIITTFLFFFITLTTLLCQQDSSWTSTVVLYHTQDINIVNQVPVHYTIGLLQVSKNSHTIVGYVGRKSNEDLNGIQMGLDYYKKMNKGYYHLGIKRSVALFYPAISLEGNYYRTISNGVEIGLGYKYLTYITDDISQTLVASGFYYIGNWMISYRGSYFNFNKLYHFGSARYIFSDDGSYIEANMSNGGEVISNHSQNELLVSSTSYGIKMSSAISRNYNLFIAYNRIFASQLETNHNYNSYSLGVKIKL